MKKKKSGSIGILIVLLIVVFIFRNQIFSFIGSEHGGQASIYQDGLESDKVGTELKKINEDLNKNSNGAEIQVIVVETMAGYDINDYAREHYKSEGLSKLSGNNGLLLVVATKDKQYATYYGAALSDEMAGDLAVAINTDLYPVLSKGVSSDDMSDFNSAMITTLKDFKKILGSYCAKMESRD